MTPDMTNSENQTPVELPPAPAKPVLGYCRGCGVALTADNVRYAMGTMYCAEHAPVPGAASDNPYAVPPPLATPPLRSDVSPGLAFILGLIPGVGAIYNGQYGKGLLHVVVFGFIIALQDQSSSFQALYGLLIPTFVFYMAFEAMHTAKRRLEGLPVDEFSSLAPLGGQGFPVGPILLMAAGVVFLLANLELISIRAMMRWWPVGLIGLGAYMLYVRTVGAGGDRHEPR